MSVSRQRKAVIAGGSVGGLFIGNMLLRQGWAVEILSVRPADLSPGAPGSPGTRN